MFSYLSRNLLKNGARDSTKLLPFCIFEHSYFVDKVRAEIIERKNKSTNSVFESYGFTESQITSLFSIRPLLFSLDRDTHIKPRLEFFMNFGFSPTDLCEILTVDEEIMRRNLEGRLIPSCEFLMTILKDSGSVIAAIKRCTWLLKQDLRKNLEPNIQLLRDYGVPDTRIVGMLKIHPRTLMQNTDRFRMLGEEVMEMGFDPTKSHFVSALQGKSGLTKSTWKRKWDYYRKWGWSDDEILTAFRKQPNVMAVSEKKIELVMDFLVNKMGWETSQIVCCPAVVMHNLENWTIPRCLVFQYLLSKGAVEKELPLSRVIVSPKSRFIKKFVDKYSEEFPEVLKLYVIPKDNTQKLQNQAIAPS